MRTPKRFSSSHTMRHVAVALTTLLLATACASDSNTAVLSDGGIQVDGDTSGVGSGLEDQEVDFRYETFDGGQQAFSTLTDKPVVVNFFASWCPTCIAEMPDFEAVYQTMGADVEFLGLAMQDRKQNAIDLIAETGITYETGLDMDGNIFGLFEGLGMPTTVFIGADGVVQRVHSGVLTADALTELINDELLT